MNERTLNRMVFGALLMRAFQVLSIAGRNFHADLRTDAGPLALSAAQLKNQAERLFLRVQRDARSAARFQDSADERLLGQHNKLVQIGKTVENMIFAPLLAISENPEHKLGLSKDLRGKLPENLARALPNALEAACSIVDIADSELKNTRQALALDE